MQLGQQLSKCQSLPTLPAVAAEVLFLCQDEELDVRDLTRVISQDPALTARILKVVNSPLFCHRREIARVSEAVVRMGTQSVRTLALSFSIVRGLHGGAAGQEDDDWFWRRSLFAATAAREFAVMSGVRGREEIFLAALLQDIGVLAMARCYAGRYSAVLKAAGHDHGRLVALERAEFHGDHLDVGVWLADHWKLPALIRTALEHSHDRSPCESLDERSAHMARCVALSSLIAEVWASDSPERALQLASRSAVERFGLSSAQFDELMDRVAVQVKEVSSIFDIPVGDPGEIQDILDAAREVLVLHCIRDAQRGLRVEEEALRLRNRNEILQERAMRDDLTGLYGRQQLDECLKNSHAQACQGGTTLSAIFCDIDHFKQINDSYGHRVGDEVLRLIAQTLQWGVQDRDLLVRYGGEEFVVIVRDLPREVVFNMAERLRHRIAVSPLTLDCGVTLHVTASFGVATHDAETPFDGPRELLHAADTALYAAKARGRDAVVMHPEVCHRFVVKAEEPLH